MHSSPQLTRLFDLAMDPSPPFEVHTGSNQDILLHHSSYKSQDSSWLEYKTPYYTFFFLNPIFFLYFGLRNFLNFQ